MVFGAKKQVLLVGNDDVQLYIVKGKKVALYADYADIGGNLTNALKEAFRDIGAPLIILFDVVEQQYRKEAIPKVSFLDKSKVIQRKLQMAFPQQQMRAFLPLKQPPKEGEGLIALFAGLAPNLTTTQIMDAVLGSEVSVQGAALLPLESTALVRKLVDATHKKARTVAATRWSILMTHHKTGGLRQVVIKDDELALTRLTPLIVDPENTQALVEEMIREFNATLTYLSRFGYIANEGLDLVLVSSDEVCRTIEGYKLNVTNLYALPLHQAGKMAGFDIARAQDYRMYGDVVHAGWVGRQRKLLIPLSTPLLDKVRQYRQMIQLLMLLLLGGLGYVAYQSFILQTGNSIMRQEIVQLKSQRVALQNQHDELAKKLNTLKYDPEKTRVVMGVHDALDKKHLNAEPLLALLNTAIDRDKILLKSLKVEPYTATAIDGAQQMAQNVLSLNQAPADPAAPAPRQSVSVKMEIAFAEGIGIEDAARMTNDLANAIKSRLPGWQVSIAEMIGNLAMDKTVQGVSEQVSAATGESQSQPQQQTSSLVMHGEMP